MNDTTIVNVPAVLSDKIDSDRIIIRSGSCKEIVRACGELRDRIIGVELEGLNDDLSPLSALPQGLSLVLKLHPDQAAGVYTSTWLSDRFSLAVLMEADKGLSEGVKIVTSAQVPVVISLDALSDDSELMSVLDYYLHSTHLQVPVEFFHSMFTARVRGMTSSLTELYPESPDQFLYIDESGQVTASARFARAGEFFGSITRGVRIDDQSSLYNMLLNPKKSLFLSGSSCVACEAFDVCTGYLRMVDTTFDCAKLLQVFDVIKAKAKEIVADLANTGKAQG